MTRVEHARRAEELLVTAKQLADALALAATENGGVVRADIHAAVFREINCLTSTAQVHATLATCAEEFHEAALPGQLPGERPIANGS